MRRRGLLGLLGTAGVAGCLRLEGGSESTTATDGVDTVESTVATTTELSTETATEEPDTTTERPEEVAYPIGLSDDGVNQFLFNSHTSALAETSFRTSWRKMNHTQGTIDHQKSYEVDSGVAVGEWTRRDGGLVEMYREASDGFWREDTGSSPLFGKDEAGFEWYKIAWQPEVKPQLSAWDWEPPERVNDDRPAEWEVTATDIADPSTTPGYHDGSVQSLEEATLRVNEDGVVRELRAKYTIDESGEAGETLTYESVYETRALGEVSVSEPSWVDAARSEVPAVRAEYVEERRFVAVTIESGGRIAGNSRIVVVPESGPADRFLVELQEPLDPGVTAYVWYDESAPSYQNARLARGSPPSDASPTSLEGDHTVIAYRRTTAYFPEQPIE